MDAAGRAARSRLVEEPLGAPQARLVRALSWAVFLQWAGAGAILPLLPLYVRQRGGSDVVVGAVMAAYFATAFVFQYGAGRLSDRLGRLPVLLCGLAVYAAGSLLFLLPVPALADVAFRALQGAGAGAAEVAALAMVTHAVPLTYRGRAVGRVYGAQLAGFAVGPVLGSVAGVGAMPVLFVVAAATAVCAAVPVVRGYRGVAHEQTAVPGAAEAPAQAAAAGPPPAAPHHTFRRRNRALGGAVLAAAAIGLPSGVYEACWTLLMVRHGAAAWEVGLSWSLFALPFAAMSRPGGWMADHLDRRWLAIGALGWSCAFCASYPFLPGVVLLVVLGAAEACGFAVALPACQSLLGEGTPPEGHGRAQGLFASSETGATAVAAACAGALYGIAVWLPFVAAAACCTVMLGVVALVWRAVPGRAQRHAAERLVGTPSTVQASGLR